MSKGRRRAARGALLAACLIFSFLFFPRRGECGIKEKEVWLNLSEEGGRIEGVLVFVLENDTSSEIESLPLLLYPRHFSREFVDRLYREDVEGKTLREGAMEIVSITADGEPLSPLGKGPLIRARLKRPLLPGERRRVRIEFSETVPNVFSAFSSVRGNFYLLGGFVPLPYFEGHDSLPVKEEGGVVVHVRGSILRGGTRLFPSDSVSAEGDGVRFSSGANLRDLGLFVVPYDVSALDGRGVRIPLFRERLSARQVERIEETLRGVAGFLRERHPALLPLLRRACVVEAPLRRRVAFFTGYGVIVSDRIFDSISLFQPQNAKVLADAFLGFVAASLLREKSTRAMAEAEFAGGLLSLEYREFVAVKTRDVRKTVSPFTFIPTFDRIYYERDLPFSREYIRTVYRFGVPGEDFPSPKERRITGDSVLRLFLSRFSPFPAGEILGEYFEGKSLLASLGERGFADDYVEALEGFPESDFSLVSVSGEDGDVEITVKDRLPVAPPEGVEVTVLTSGGDEKRLHWDTSEREKRFRLKLGNEKVENVVIDRDLRYDDVDRSNNYMVRPLRVLLQSTRFNYDFNTGSVTASALVTLQRAYEKERAFQVYLEKTNDSSALELSYLKALSIGKEGGDYLQLGLRGTHDSSLKPSDSTIVEARAGFLKTSFDLSFLPAGDSGGSLSGSLGFSGKGGRKTFWSVEGRIVRYFRLDRMTTVAVKVDGGVTGGSVPSSRGLDFGGRDHIRGLRPGDARMDSLLVGTAEFRRYLSRDLDVDLPWGIFSLSGFALHLFVDAGVGDYADFSDVRGRSFRSSAGTGLFFEGNFLGIAPVKLNFQFARELDRFAGATTYFYFRMNQNF
ncbi:MAG: hypothetical protein D6713_07860 [Deltaproteobacteria bacterium]|nr:MAG: hypothetical protein D6713_07860 [Deltaproteobacteria bacterium]